MKIKTLFILSSLLLINALVSAQITYQAVVRDSDNIPLHETDVQFNVALVKGENNELIYSEVHNVNTGSLGLVNFNIGAGQDPSSSYASINWASEKIKAQISIDGEAFEVIDLQSVPYANSSLLAKNVRGGFENSQVRVSQNTSSLNSKAFIELWGDNGSRDGELGLAGRYISFRTDVTDSDYGNPVARIIENGNFGVGTSTPTHKMHIKKSNGYGQLKLERTGNDAGHSLLGGSNSGFYVGHTNTSDTYVVDFKVSHSGKAEVKCLEILGGCDIKEDFNSAESLQPGDVVIIDENNPGQLKKCDSQYDRKVAGIISGANGINPGLSLSQDGVLVGEYPLAMLGQVYVKATGNVNVGDLLTTSELSGHAMAVSDYSISPGAVIGKAMTGQEGGEGFVLVLVNLQ